MKKVIIKTAAEAAEQKRIEEEIRIRKLKERICPECETTCCKEITTRSFGQIATYECGKCGCVYKVEDNE